jgi:hypothetical protein
MTSRIIAATKEAQLNERAAHTLSILNSGYYLLLWLDPAMPAFDSRTLRIIFSCTEQR